MRIVHGYRDDKILRDSFNELAGKVYGGLNFEGWYQNGFDRHTDPVWVLLPDRES